MYVLTFLYFLLKYFCIKAHIEFRRREWNVCFDIAEDNLRKSFGEKLDSIHK